MGSRKTLRSAVHWEGQAQSDNLESMAAIIGKAVWQYICVSLLVISAALILSVPVDVFLLSFKDVARILIILLFLVVIFDIILLYAENRISQKGGKPFLLRIGAALVTGFAFFKTFLSYYEKNKSAISKGWRFYAAEYVEPYNRIFGKNLFFGDGGDKLYLTDAAFFWIMIGMAGVFLLCFLIRKKNLFLIMPLAAFYLVMIIGQTPDWPSILVFVAGLYMLLGCKPGKSKVMQSLIAISIFMSVFIVSGSLYENAASKLMGKVEATKDFQEMLETKVNNFINGLFMEKDNTISNRKPKYDDSEIMLVSVEKKPSENLYFPSYYGSFYSDGKWTGDEEYFRSECANNGISTAKAGEYLFDRYYTVLSPDIESTGLELDYHGFAGRAMLLPYGSLSADTDGVEYYGDVTVLKGRLSGSTGARILSDHVFHFRRLYRILRNSKDPADEEGDFFRWYNRYAFEKNISLPENSSKLFELFADQDYLQNGRYEYLSSDPIYNSLSGDIVETIGDVDNFGNAVKFTEADYRNVNLYRLSRAVDVADYLTSYYSYSWNLDGISDGTDPIEYFLNTGRKGYCEHFASAGVLLLRGAGVPARFASGYVIKPGAFEKNGDRYEAAVIDRNSHAWVEIYLENLGWIPIEVTPGYSSATSTMPTDDDEAEKREAREKYTPTPTPAATNTPRPTAVINTVTPTVKPTKAAVTKTPKPSKEATPTKGTGPGGNGQGGNTDNESGKPVPVKLILTIAGILLFAGALVYGIRKHLAAIRKKLENDLRQKRYRSAVKRMNRRLYKRLFRKGKFIGLAFSGDKNAGGITDEKYAKVLKEYYKEIPEEDWDAYMKIVIKAAFSEEQLEKEEAEAVYRIYKNCR